MALSFIQWEKYIQGFPDDRLGQEFKDPGSTVPGMAPPPQNLIVSEMGNRNAARQADEAMRASQGQPSGTIAEQTYNEFAGEDRPVGGPGGGPPPGGPPGGGPPGGGPPGGPGGPPGPGGPGGPPPGGPPMGPGGPPMGGPPPGGPPMGGPPMGGPPMGGPPMMAHGGLIPGYQEGGDTEGFLSGLGRLTTGAGSWEEAMENPFKTTARTALSLAMLHPMGRMVGGAGRLALGLKGGARMQRLLEGAGKGTLALREAGGKRKVLARLLDPKQARSKTPGWIGGRAGTWVKDPKTGKQIWDAGAGVKSGLAGIGRRSIMRGGGALGITGLIAMDPFDAGDPETNIPEPNTDPTSSSAIRADRSKGFGNGGFDWLSDETQAERDLGELMAYRSASDFGDEYTSADEFQDRANQAWMDRRDRRYSPDIDAMDSAAQGYVDLPGMASGGIMGLGYHEGGHISTHTHGSDPGQHLVDSDPYQGSTLEWGGRFADPDPDARYITGERSVQQDIERILGRGLSTAAAIPRIGEYGLRNLWEMVRGGQQYGPEMRGPGGNLLIDGRDPRDEGFTGQKVRRRVPTSEELEVPVGLGDTPDVEGVEEPDVDHEGVDGPISADTVLGTTGERINRALEAEALWGRTETPGEAELRKYQLARAEGARQDSTNLLYADVAEAIAGSGGVPGGIARGLSKAIRGQIEQGNLARDYEGLPITAAAARSRYNTYAEQNQALQDIFRAASSRGDIDATIAGRLDEVYATLQESRRLTPQALIQVSEILRTLFEDKTIDEATRKQMWSDIAGGRMRQIQAQASLPRGRL